MYGQALESYIKCYKHTVVYFTFKKKKNEKGCISDRNYVFEADCILQEEKKQGVKKECSLVFLAKSRKVSFVFNSYL